MRLVIFTGIVISLLGWSGFVGTVFWWLTAAVMVIYGLRRRTVDICSQRIGLAVIVLAVIMPLMVDNTLVRFALALVLGFIWIFIHLALWRHNAPLMLWHKEVVLVLYGYGALCFFLSVMRGNWWLFASWFGFIGFLVFLTPCYLRACGLVVSRFEVWVVTFLLSQILLVLYFLPLPLLSLVMVYFVCCVWVLHELVVAAKGGQWWPGLGLRLAGLSVFVSVLLFVLRF